LAISFIRRHGNRCFWPRRGYFGFCQTPRVLTNLEGGAARAEAKVALDAAQPGANAVPNPGTRAGYKALLAGLNGVVDAERQHAGALKSLLADGNTAKAKNQLLQGVAD
jgi:hypothetical protein